MFSIVWYQLAGFLGALIIHTGFVGMSLAASRRHWPLVYLAGLLGVCSFFSLQAFVTFKPVILVIVVGVALVGNALFLRRFRWNKAYLKAPALLALLALGILALYAAFPDYRYDQWNYHLNVGKQIVRGGAFSLPVIYDHIYFSGIYDFIAVIPRYFWDDDIFAHCFSNGFSFLILVTSLGGVVGLYLRDYEADSYLAWLVVAAVLFAIPDHEVLVSSKPDGLLICYALGVVWLLVSREVPDRFRHLLLPLFIAGPVAFKLTYIHFSLAALVAWLLCVVAKRYPLNRTSIQQLGLGSTIALFLTLPFLIKNYMFFGNPVHPVQAAVFKSTYWSPDFAMYWETVSNGAKTGSAYAATLMNLPASLAKMVPWFLLLIVGVVVLGWKKRQDLPRLRSSEGLVLISILLTFLVLWPAFYSAGIFPRFVYPVLSVFIAVFLIAFSRLATKRGPFLVLLLIPIVANGSLDVKLLRLSAAWQAPEQFFDNGRMPHKHWLIDKVLNDHRAQAFPGATFRQHRALVQSNITYFLDTERLDVEGPDIGLQKALSPGYKPGCPWALLDAYDVNYLRTVYMPFSQWPEEYQPVIQAASQIDPKDFVRYIPSDTIKFHLAQCGKSQG